MIIDIETSGEEVDPLHVFHVLKKAGYLVERVTIDFGEDEFVNPEMAEAF